MKVEYSEESSVRKSLSFEIEPEVVDKEIEARTQQYARRVKLPGFRPGRIPPDVIKQRFRAQVLEDVAEKIVNKVVFEELEGRGLKPLAAPKVTDLKIDENRPLTFRAVFETLPLIEVPDYRGLPVDARKPGVTDEDVDREIDRLREGAARYDPIEGRPTQRGDFAVVDLAWKPADGGRGGRDENALMEVGGEGNHEDMNTALTGMSPGDVKKLRVAYPEDYAARSVAGQTLEYTVALKAIKEKVIPAVDDEFAKDLGDWGRLAELRAHLREKLLKDEERRADRDVKKALVDALVAKADFEVPEALVERHMTARTENAARGLAFQGIDPAKAGVDWRRYRDAQRGEAVRAAKADILLDEIARREGIEVGEAEVDAELSRLAQRVNRGTESLRLKLEKDGELAALRARIREDKTLDLLKANARLNLG